ncbi:hypothetical protein Tco_0619983 [Tanacetum coccineum]
MADSSSQEQIPQQQDQPNRPGTPIPLDHAPHVDFTLKEINLKTNNEVSLLYPDHPNKKTFICVSDFISKFLEETNKVWFSTPTGGIKGEVGLTSFKNDNGINYLSHSRNYVTPSTIETCLGGKTGGYNQITNKDAIILYCLENGVNIDYARLIWENILAKLKKAKREKVVPYPRKTNLKDLPSLPICWLFAMQMCQWHLKLQTPLPIVGKRFPKAKTLELQLDTGENKLLLLQNIILSTNPYVLVDKTTSTSEGLETILTKPVTEKEASKAKKEVSIGDDEFNTSLDLSSSDDAQKEIKLEDLSKLVQNVEVNFMDLDSPEYDVPIIIKDEDEEEVHAEKDDVEQVHVEDHKEFEDASASQSPSLNSDAAKIEATLLKDKPSFSNVEQLTELLVKSLTPKLSKLLSSHDFSNSLPTKLKELPSKFNNLTGESKELKKHVHELEIELSGDLKEILTKLEKFSSTVSSQDQDLGCLTEGIHTAKHGTHPAEGPPKTSSQYEGELINSKGKETMSHKETKEEESETDSEPVGDHVHLTNEHIKEKKRIKESVNADMAKKEEVVGKEELVDLLGVDVVTEVYKAKIKYDKYCDKMLNRRIQSRITNCDVLTRKGLITLKVYRNDRTDEVTPNFKASDLHLSEWRDVMQACPKRTRAGWTSIYEKIQTRMHNLKKRKHADDIHDYFRSTKRYKSSFQYEDHPAETVLNEPCLGMIMFNSHQRQDFVTIEDFKHLNNEMLSTVQEIFFRLHQGPGIDDHARTFSSSLLHEVNKRNVNPLKQMRVIKQLRQ